MKIEAVTVHVISEKFGKIYSLFKNYLFLDELKDC